MFRVIQSHLLPTALIGFLRRFAAPAPVPVHTIVTPPAISQAQQKIVSFAPARRRRRARRIAAPVRAGLRTAWF